MTEHLRQKLAELPKTPGVYFHKNAAGEVIYVGKAAVLRNRVRQYFQKSRLPDPKTEALVAEIRDVEWIETESEIDALFLEAEMIRRYLPPYNILLRDDKSLQYVRIDSKSDHPTVTFTRRPLDDGADYFGPYVSAWAVKRALKYLRRIFPYAVQGREGALGSRLYEQLGLDPGLDSGRTSLEAYRANLRQLARYLRGERTALLSELERDMRRASQAQDYETAARLRNQIANLKALSHQIIFSDREMLDISKDRGLVGLADLLGLPKPPRRIEGYDISHMSGTDTVASMVVFTSGLPDKAAYRKFKMRLPGNDDFAHMREVISRRLTETNRKHWGLPDLFLIDGGKGQLSAAMEARDAANITIPMIGLAKRHETIILKNPTTPQFPPLQGLTLQKGEFAEVSLPLNSDVVKLLQRIRDESHRFAVSYHTSLKRSRQTTSWLEEVPGIGPQTRKKLLKTFGSARGVLLARQWELERVIGTKKATILQQYARPRRKSP